MGRPPSDKTRANRAEARVAELEEQIASQDVFLTVKNLVDENVAEKIEKQAFHITSLLEAIPALKARYRVSQQHVVDLTGKLAKALKRNKRLGEKLAAEKAQNAVLREINKQLMARSVTVSADGTVEA